jgi:hypothetical protein
MTEHREPTLEDLLSEPIIRTVMASDGVRGADIRRLLQRVRARDEQNAPGFARDAGHRQGRHFEGACSAAV